MIEGVLSLLLDFLSFVIVFSFVAVAVTVEFVVVLGFFGELNVVGVDALDFLSPELLMDTLIVPINER